MSEQIEQPHNLWSFHPLTGLTIRNEEPDLDHPLWGNSTIISKKNIPQVADLLISNPEQKTLFISFLETAPVNEIFDSFILIKRKAFLPNSNVCGTSLSDELTSYADKIEALLALFHLKMAVSTDVCALSDKIPRISETFTLVDIETGAFSWSGNHVKLQWRNPLPTSREELNYHLNDERFRVLKQTLLLEKSNLSNSFKDVIIQSALMLSSSLQAPNFSTQLINAVTAIEIILSSGNKDEKYDLRKQRIKYLLGDQAYTALTVDLVFQARHNFVHGGLPIKDKTLAIKAVGIAYSSLMYYCKAAPDFKNKTHFLDYLDLLHEVYKFDQYQDQENNKLFPKLQKHDMYGWYYPFLWDNV